MKICRKSLVTVLLFLMTVCLLLSAAFVTPVKKVFAESGVAYDFTEATDANNFGTKGAAWEVQDGKFYANAEWASSYLKTPLDTGKEFNISFDLVLNKHETQNNMFWLGFASDDTLASFKGLRIIPDTVWFNTGFGSANWLGEDATVKLYDGKTYTVSINVKNGEMHFEIDNKPFACSNGLVSMEVPVLGNSTACYFAMQSASANCYIDNFEVVEVSPADSGAIDFEEATDADLFEVATGSNAWQIVEGKYTASADSALYAGTAMKLKQSIDLTKDQEIAFDFAITKYNFDIALVDVNENIWGKTAHVLHFLEYGTTGLATLNNNIDMPGSTVWYKDYPLPTDYTDGAQHTLKMVVASGTVTYYVDGVEAASAAIPANEVYLVFRACGAGTYIDNLTISKNLSVKNIAGEVIDTLNVTNVLTLPERSEAGFIGYNVDGKLYPAGYEISTANVTEIVAVIVNLETEDKASIRWQEPAGLRFQSKIDSASKTYLEGMNASFTFGTIIVKSEDVAVEGNVDYTAITVDCAYTKLVIQSTVGETVDSDYMFYAALVDIKENHYSWYFAARAYITVTYADGTEATVYATGGTSRSVSHVAQALIDDETTFGEFPPEAQEIIRGFIVDETAVYLSVNGNDENDGASLSSAVFSPQKAVELAEGDRNRILVGDGEYFLNETLQINKNVTFEGLFGNAVFSGASKIDNASVVEVTDPTLGRIWEIPYDKKATQLYVGNTHATRARFPDAGEELRLLFADTTLRTVTVDQNDLGTLTVSDIKNSIMVPSVAWTDSYLTVTGIRETTVSGYPAYQLSFLSENSGFFERAVVIHPRASYHFENAKAFLSVAGEFYCDENADKIYYIPHDDESLDTVEIRIPTTETLVNVSGSAENKLTVAFDGITFAYTANDVDGKIGGQANLDYAYSSQATGVNAYRPISAISVSFVENFTFTNNKTLCTANGGLDLVQGISNANVSGNRFIAIGGNGILAGATNTNAVEVEATLNNPAYRIQGVSVENNYLSEIAWQEYGGVGIVFTYTVDCKISRNDIRGASYSGISVGWGWETLATSKDFVGNNEISYNRLTNVCSYANDGGAIYLAGCQNGTKVINNYIADVYNYTYHYPYDKKTDYGTYSQIWWANAGIYLDTAAGSDDPNAPLEIAGNYVAADVGNQRYEYNNSDCYFTIDGKDREEISIDMENGVSASLYASTGVTDGGLLPSTPVLFGSRTVDKDTVTVYGINLTGAELLLDDEAIASITERTDTYVTFTTTAYTKGGHAVRVGDSQIAVTTGVDFEYDSVTRFKEKFGADFYNTLRYDNVVKKQTISTTSSDFTSSAYYESYPPKNLCDGELGTGWSMDMAAETPGYVSFKLKTAATVDKVIVYARIDTEGGDVERSNFTITGITSTGNRVNLFTTTGEAYEAYGMLVVNVAETEYANTVFSGFELKKNDNSYFFVAEVAVI